MFESIFFVVFFIVLIIVLIGWATLIKGALPGIKKIWLPSKEDESALSKQKGYECENCGAGLGENADISPSGDVKCTYCNKWFNIHGKPHD